MSVLYLVLAGVLGGVAGMLLRLASIRNTNGEISSLYLVAALVFYGAGFILYSVGLRKVALSTGYPLMVGVSMVIAFGFDLYMREQIGAVPVIGAALILVGVALVAWHR